MYLSNLKDHIARYKELCLISSMIEIKQGSLAESLETKRDISSEEKGEKLLQAEM